MSRTRLSAIITILALGALTPALPGCAAHTGGTPVAQRDIETVMNDHVDALMARDGVVGVMIGATVDGAPCIKVLLARADAALQRTLPSQLEGYPVEVEVSGEFRPY